MLTRAAGQRTSAWLHQYAHEKRIFLKVCHFNADHAHAVIDLPTNRCLEEVVQLFKGASSHWINEQKMVPGRFAWGRGYGAFSVSESALPAVVAYVENQVEHHRGLTSADELKLFVERYGLKWHGLETVETVSKSSNGSDTPR